MVHASNTLHSSPIGRIWRGKLNKFLSSESPVNRDNHFSISMVGTYRTGSTGSVLGTRNTS